MANLNPNRGTFITLSQYVNDLTINRSEGSNYKVIPSKFTALNVNFSKSVNGSSLTNSSIIDYITNFENNQRTERIENNYNSTIFATNFGSSFFGEGKIFLDNEKVYDGNVNIISASEVDGVAYSDIYCYISDQVQSTSHSFNINTIIVYYNVKNNDGTYIYENIPLGIYFTGSIENGSMSNSITKYNTIGDDGIGTSYGIRISSKFITTTDTTLQVNDDSQYYAEMSHVLSKMDDTYQKLNDLISNIHGQTQSYKDLYAIFKNSRTNVPYIKEVNGVKYWFVNGRQLELVTNDMSTESVSGLQLSFIEPQTTLFEYIAGQSYEINFKWDVLYNRIQIVPDQLRFKYNIEEIEEIEVGEESEEIEEIEVGEELEEPNDCPDNNCPDNESLKLIPNMNSLIYKVKPNGIGSHNFIIEAEYKGNEAKVQKTINFVYPSYYGIIPCEHSDSENHWDGITDSPITEDNINTLTKILSTDKSNNLVFNLKNGWGHIVYVYPKSNGDLGNSNGKKGITYNGFDYTDDYQKFEQTINKTQYNVYVSKVGIYEGSYQIKFA